MGCVSKGIVLFIQASFLNQPDFPPYAKHSVTETVQFVLVFTFGRFHHNGSGYRKGHGRRVKTVIHEALGDINRLNFHGLLERSQINYKFVCAGIVMVGIQDLKLFLQPCQHIVGT